MGIYIPSSFTCLFFFSCSDVKFFDAGDYLCNATNKFGSAHASGSLVVKEHTRITGRPQDYEVEAGDTATFRCNAVYDSDLRLKIKWLKDGELIDFDTEPRFVQSSDQSLTITKTTELDSGKAIYFRLANKTHSQ